MSDISLTIDCSAALTPSLVESVTAACDRAEDAQPGSIVVLQITSGEPRDTPADPGSGWPGDSGVHLVNKWERALRRLERVPAAVIAVAAGPLTGPGLEALLTADYRIGTTDLALSLPVGDGSVWPSMALHRLSQQLGVARARQLALFGTEVPAERALGIGLIDEIAHDEEEVLEAVARAAKLAAELTGSEIAIRRRLLLDATTTSFEESLGVHLSACDRTLRRARELAEARTA
ncbi:hypothetical protein ACZ90_64800 [Streptomyces albus subsp. albus]|nr:hypothetical protein ACZ90_64800 [Streptomyces albus subsp. albus]